MAELEKEQQTPAEAESEDTTTTASKMIDTIDEDDAMEQPLSKGKKKKKLNLKPKGRRSESDLDLKKLTQRRINVAGAPKMPLNGYVRFMNDRREELKRDQPQRTALEHTKIIGEEWHQLADDRKAPYMEAAAKDKAVYQEQLHLFLKEHPEIVAKELAKAKSSKMEGTPKEKAAKTELNTSKSSAAKKSKAAAASKKKTEPLTETDIDDIPLAEVKRRSPTSPQPQLPPPPQAQSLPRPIQSGEIPIYTNEFIEHNRSTENELRTLRKTKTDLEQQNAVLEQHVDNTKAGYAKVMGEVAELKEENQRLEAYVKGLRKKLVTALIGIDLPPIDQNGPSVDNIDKYMQHVASLTSQSNNIMLLKVREALRKLDTKSLLKS